MLKFKVDENLPSEAAGLLWIVEETSVWVRG